MKIRTRNELLRSYRNKYREIINDPEERIRTYFKDNNLDFDKAVKKAEVKLLNICKNIDYKTIKIILYEYPMKTDRSRLGRGTVYSPNAKSNKDYLKRVVDKILKDIKLVNTPAKVKIDAYLEMPTSVPPDEIILYEAKILKVYDTPDYDNISKCYTDMKKDVLILDDDIFYSGTSNKYYSLLPRVEINVRYQNKHDSDYVFKKLKARKSIKEGLAKGLIELKRI